MEKLQENLAKVETLSERLIAALSRHRNHDPALNAPSNELFMKAAQAYLADLEASVETPRWNLAGMMPVELEPGAEAEVRFVLDARQMAVVTEDGRHVVEPGRFRVFVGDTQPDARSRALGGAEPVSVEFDVTGSVTLPA